jgi:hypothetical protein
VPSSVSLRILLSHFQEARDGSVSVHSTLDVDTVLARYSDSEAEPVRVIESRVFQLLS